MENQRTPWCAALSSRPRLWPILLISGIGIAVLVGLGFWQVQRLHWKEGLIAQLQARMAEPAVPFAQALLERNGGEYRKVELVGQLDTGRFLFKQTSADDFPAWEVLAAFRIGNESPMNDEVIVDLGTSQSRDITLLAASKLTGVIRLHNLGRGIFDPANNPTSNTWHWWDLSAMKSALAINANAPSVVVQSMEPNGAVEPLPAMVELRNAHLGYAITWFGLAAALVGVAAAFVFARKPE